MSFLHKTIEVLLRLMVAVFVSIMLVAIGSAGVLLGLIANLAIFSNYAEIAFAIELFVVLVLMNFSKEVKEEHPIEIAPIIDSYMELRIRQSMSEQEQKERELYEKLHAKYGSKKTSKQPWMCNHANECPMECTCGPDCVCKERYCKEHYCPPGWDGNKD